MMKRWRKALAQSPYINEFACSIACNYNKLINVNEHKNFAESTQNDCDGVTALTRRDRVTHICVCKFTIFGRHQAIIWTNDETSLIGPLGIYTF